MVPRRIFSIFSTTYYSWVRAEVPRTAFLIISTAYYFWVRVVVPRSVLSVFSTAYYSRVRDACPSKCFSRPSAPCILFSSKGCPFASSLEKYPNMLAINLIGCCMSNTKVRPQLAILIGPVYVANAFCQENFHAFGMKEYTDGCVECNAFTELRFDKTNTARVEVMLVHVGSSQGTQTWVS
jgi:hypothetical protein